MPRHDQPKWASRPRRSVRPSTSSAAPDISPGNATIRAARDLKTSQGRREQRRYLLEGIRLLEDSLEQGLEPVEIFLTPHLIDGTPRGRHLAEWLRERGFPIIELPERLLRLISDTETPPGIIAVAAMPEPLLDLPAPWSSGLCSVILDQVRDPGNVGGILRTAGAAGIQLVASTEGSVDMYSPKVVRAGAGAHLRVELAAGRAIDELNEWLNAWPQVVLADGRASRTMYDVDWRRPSVLIVSNEAHGSGEWLQDRPLLRAAVPMSTSTESLNVAASTAVILYEARRSFLRGS